ncbi:MAG: hypothetical protein JXQ81_05210 [Desulfuromonadales bacterium]|nr:hypothetical protein [Desulfuromonadales bacterium]MBN2791889.1 hypothetical protein [Desulfuromonadales bacterium]
MIIGFAGKAASGKTTAARYLVQLQQENIVILPMALVLREEVENFICQVGAEDKVPLIYGDQDDKVRVFYVDTEQALSLCPEWSGFVAMNADIQDREAQTAVTVRRILQWWGTEYRRAQDPDYWTTAWEQKLREFDLSSTHILVDDVRFVNELNVIKDNGGYFIRIVRPGFDGANNHSSENSLDDYAGWDLVIDNDGSLEDFLAEVKEQVVPLLDKGSVPL